jgi:hypothetical protein
MFVGLFGAVKHSQIRDHAPCLAAPDAPTIGSKSAQGSAADTERCREYKAHYFFLLGTFFPARRASDRPIAMACFLLFTFRPLPPLFRVPRLRSCIARFTFFDAAFEYLRAAMDYLRRCVPKAATLNTARRSSHCAGCKMLA